MGGLLTDFRYALRFVSRSPTFALVAVLTLALGIGVNTAIFSIVSAVLLEPLPYPAPDKLCLLFEGSPQRGLTQELVSAADFQDWRSQNRSFSVMSAVGFNVFRYAESSGALRVEGMAVSQEYFKLLGASPILGRAFAPEEYRPGSDNVVAITESFWRGNLASDPAVVGKSIRLNGRPFTILAVFPDSAVPLAVITDIKMLQPMGWTDAEQHDRSLRNLLVIGRLRDGVSMNQAQADVLSISRQISRQYPATNANWNAELVPYVKMALGDARQQLFILVSIAALVLLIACVNLASLFSSRLTARQHEIVVWSGSYLQKVS
jgi:predicted permease